MPSCRHLDGGIQLATSVCALLGLKPMTCRSMGQCCLGPAEPSCPGPERILATPLQPQPYGEWCEAVLATLGSKCADRRAFPLPGRKCPQGWAGSGPLVPRPPPRHCTAWLPGPVGGGKSIRERFRPSGVPSNVLWPCSQWDLRWLAQSYSPTHVPGAVTCSLSLPASPGWQEGGRGAPLSQHPAVLSPHGLLVSSPSSYSRAHEN